MTDDDWFDCIHVRQLLTMTPDLGEREQWLFAARCLTRPLDWVAHPLLPDIITVCFRLADRPDSARLRDALENLRFDILPEGVLDEELGDLRDIDRALHNLQLFQPDLALVASDCRDALMGRERGSVVDRGEELFQLDILRDLVPPPSALPWDARWETETVLLLSSLIESRAEFSLSPVFADALEDAGCGCAARLAHLRSETASHGTGCWALAPGRRASSAATPPAPRANPLFCD